MSLVTDLVGIVKEHWLLLLLVSVPILIYWHYIVNFTLLKKLGIPGPAPLPLIGNLTIFLDPTNLNTYFHDACKKYGKIFGLYFAKQASVIVADPQIIKTILVKEFDKFNEQPSGGGDFPEPLASMITALKGQRWKDVRSILTPTFTSGKLRGMTYIMNEAADTLLIKMEKAAEENQVVDIGLWHRSISMEIMLSASVGVKSESQTNPNDKITQYTKEAINAKMWPYLVLMIPFVGKTLSKKMMLTSWGFNWSPLIGIANKIIKQRKEDENCWRDDILQNMISAQHPDRKGHKLSEDELLAQVIAFILAGYDTTSSALSLTCYHLAIFPEIQEKVYEEIERVCQSKITTNYDEIKEMHYLDACISETLRLYPPVYMLARKVNESCIINGIQFKEDMAVFVPVYAMHHNEEFWSEPNTFKPERFLPENRESINPYTYLPFGAGPRNCIGMRFALMEMKSVLARILLKFRLVRDTQTPMPIKVESKTILGAAEPVNIRFEKRF